MRQPQPSDVLAAVEYVTGVDPLGPLTHGRVRSTRARRLACHSLDEICELGPSAIGRVLGIDHTTVHYHLERANDYEAAKMVLQRVSDVLGDEDLAQAKVRSQRLLEKAMMEG